MQHYSSRTFSPIRNDHPDSWHYTTLVISILLGRGIIIVVSNLSVPRYVVEKRGMFGGGICPALSMADVLASLLRRPKKMRWTDRIDWLIKKSQHDGARLRAIIKPVVLCNVWARLLLHVIMYRVAPKSRPTSLNFVNCWPIFKIISAAHSAVNFCNKLVIIQIPPHR